MGSCLSSPAAGERAPQQQQESAQGRSSPVSAQPRWSVSVPSPGSADSQKQQQASGGDMSSSTRDLPGGATTTSHWTSLELQAVQLTLLKVRDEVVKYATSPEKGGREGEGGCGSQGAFSETAVNAPCAPPHDRAAPSGAGTERGGRTT